MSSAFPCTSFIGSVSTLRSVARSFGINVATLKKILKVINFCFTAGSSEVHLCQLIYIHMSDQTLSDTMSGYPTEKISLPLIRAAHSRIKPHIHETPVFTSETLNRQSGLKLFFKAEILQKTGAFKARGACNAVLSLKEQNPEAPGVVTHSSGNHGQGVAYAARIANFPCSIVVPEGSPEAKVKAIKGYGAELVYCKPTPNARKEACDKIAKETGRIVIHPFDNYDVMGGQGTIACEFLQQIPELDAILVPISGGGMTAGISVATKGIKPECKVGPKGKQLQECLESGKRLWSNPPCFLDTIADAIRLQQVGELTFPILCQLAEKRVFAISDEEMVNAQKMVWERMKLVIETASGAAVAAALSFQKNNMDPNIKNVGVILSGGNVDLDRLPWLLGP